MAIIAETGEVLQLLKNNPLSECGRARIFYSALNCVARRDRFTPTEHKCYFDNLGGYLKARGERTAPQLLRYEQ